MKDHEPGYISMGKLLDKLKDNLESIVNTPELIHNKSFMMGIMEKMGK